MLFVVPQSLLSQQVLVCVPSMQALQVGSHSQFSVHVVPGCPIVIWIVCVFWFGMLEFVGS